MNIKTYQTDPLKHWCNCPAFRYQRKPLNLRLCKHLLSMGVKSIDDTYTWKAKTDKPQIMLYSDIRGLIQPMWWASEKLDGVRGRWTGKEMVSRSGFIIDIPDSIRSYLPSGLILDGEFATEKRNNLQVSINATQSHKFSKCWENVNFYIFDVFNTDPFLHRYQLIKKFPFFCKQTPIYLDNIDAELKIVCEKEGEGLIIRNPKGLYTTKGRSKDVVKVKPTYQGTATYIDGSTFQEVDTGFNFRMKPPPNIQEGTTIHFQYRDRTTLGKPKYPRIT